MTPLAVTVGLALSQETRECPIRVPVLSEVSEASEVTLRALVVVFASNVVLVLLFPSCSSLSVL